MAPQLNTQKVLVAGGSGYFGWRIIRWLVHETRMSPALLGVIDRAPPTEERREEGVRYLEVDITDTIALSRAFDEFKPEVVIHTASPPPSTLNLSILMRNNVDGTRNLLECTAAQPTTRAFIYTSSSSVTHDTVSDLIEATENFPNGYVVFPKQRNAYSHSKAVAEELALKYNRKRKDLVVAAIRPSVLFGPGERATIDNSVDRAKRGSLRYQIGEGANTMDFTYVDNTVIAVILLANALLRELESPAPLYERVEGEAFIITNDEHRKFWEFFRDVGAAAGYPTDPNQIKSLPKDVMIGLAIVLEWLYWLLSFGTKISPMRRADMTYSTIIRTFDISKAKKRLGYHPRFSIDEGIKLSVEPLIDEKKNI